MATLVLTNTMTLQGTAWTGTAPGPANPTPSGTITSTTDWSDHIFEVKIGMKVNMDDFTTFGDGGFATQKPGLKSTDLSISFNQDYTTSVDATYAVAFFAGTLLYLDLKPTNSSRAATNPSIVVAAYVMSYPYEEKVGERAAVTVDFGVTGTYARLTS